MIKPPRPTVSDVARAAGVGVATVDRVLNRRAPVREDTARRVLEAAQAIGFHGTPLLRRRLEEGGEARTFGFLLQKGSQSFYQGLGAALGSATRACTAVRGKPVVQYLEDLSPAHVASRLRDLGAKADAVSLVAADHPKVSQAVEALKADGVPVFTLLSDLSTPARAAFFGIDHRKAGRTAAWSVSRLGHRPGKVGIFVGSHRYLGQDLCEISFRSYLREHAPEFTVLDAVTSLEDTHFAHEAALDLLQRNRDLVGLYVAGGGVEGIIEALREHGASNRIVVCNELIPETRAALIDGVVDVVIGTPLRLLAERAVAGMARSFRGGPNEAEGYLPFELHISENL